MVDFLLYLRLLVVVYFLFFVLLWSLLLCLVLVGWIGLFTVFPWVHALIWAFHDSITIDVRKFLGRHDAESADVRGTDETAAPAKDPVHQATERKEPAFKTATTTADKAGDPS